MTNAETNALRVHASAAHAALDAAYYAREARFRREAGLEALAVRAEEHAEACVKTAEWNSDWADTTERRAGVSVFPGVRPKPPTRRELCAKIARATWGR